MYEKLMAMGELVKLLAILDIVCILYYSNN